MPTSTRFSVFYGPLPITRSTHSLLRRRIQFTGAEALRRMTDQLRAETLHTSWPKRPPSRDGVEADSHTVIVGGALGGGEKERECVYTEVILVIASTSP